MRQSLILLEVLEKLLLPSAEGTYPALSAPRRWMSAHTGSAQPPPGPWGPPAPLPQCPGTPGRTWSGCCGVAAAQPERNVPVSSSQGTLSLWLPGHPRSGPYPWQVSPASCPVPAPRVRLPGLVFCLWAAGSPSTTKFYFCLGASGPGRCFPLPASSLGACAPTLLWE